ncbi:MAG: CBS domain-containing protein [Actinobacteria bacterium]|nr:CBS domain-containing protein [Actinomycetota bacterium]
MEQAETFHGRAGGANLDELFGTIGDAMTRNVVALEPKMKANDAALMLGEAGVAGGPVIRKGQVVGVVTLRDLLRREGHTTPQTTGPFLRGERHLTDLTVEDVMTKDVVTARADWPLTRAILVMDEAQVNRLPVLDAHGRPVGILAREDVMRAVAGAIRGKVPRIPHPSVIPGMVPQIPPD